MYKWLLLSIQLNVLASYVIHNNTWTQNCINGNKNYNCVNFIDYKDGYPIKLLHIHNFKNYKNNDYIEISTNIYYKYVIIIRDIHAITFKIKNKNFNKIRFSGNIYVKNLYLDESNINVLDFVKNNLIENIYLNNTNIQHYNISNINNLKFIDLSNNNINDLFDILNIKNNNFNVKIDISNNNIPCSLQYKFLINNCVLDDSNNNYNIKNVIINTNTIMIIIVILFIFCIIYYIKCRINILTFDSEYLEFIQAKVNNLV
ncbi:unknown similar to AMEV128 [Adoxophyes honmai entomopoxvirus 'L']|uniref:Uncharacterized protein n=1 Tax=Adoxophyes honmai entomopoxvirus 'L' TaxID=1293540 RepID=A0A916KP54_9POXV|nr:unknown similar to AMEV128 [Adoxophyes honmai entomopoxvirus 'L']CCU55475.1 unknown similar to AMEV128 [Adoxophyes honmai entomopoxvirus 'L']